MAAELIAAGATDEGVDRHFRVRRISALRLLAFSRRGSLPMGKMGERLMVHPASVTNAIPGWNTAAWSNGAYPRRPGVVLATITPNGQALGREATEALNQTSFS